jgi:hypothetical protein
MLKPSHFKKQPSKIIRIPPPPCKGTSAITAFKKWRNIVKTGKTTIIIHFTKRQKKEVS